MSKEKPDLLEMIEQSTPEDLEKVNEQIAVNERRLDALKAIRKVLYVKINGKAPRKSPTPRPIGGGNEQTGRGSVKEAQRLAVLKYLRHAGAATLKVLEEKCNIPNGSLAKVVDCDWFSKEGSNIRLTLKGKDRAEDLDS